MGRAIRNGPLWLNGRDLRKTPLSERQRTLRSVVPEGSSTALFAKASSVAGEVRRFFRFNPPDLLTSGSDLNLITFEYQDGEEALIDHFGKKGKQVPIPPPLLKQVLTLNEECALPYFRNLLAAGLVTCITEYGVERDVALFEEQFWDLCD